MRWSWPIARIAGIGIYLHVTFLLLLGWVAWEQYDRFGTLRSVLNEVGFVLIVFFIIVLHELGHALAARRYGIQTRDITLLPIGGVARLERIPENPWQELVVAVAGPAVNVVLAIGLFLWLQFVEKRSPDADLWQVQGSLAQRLLGINVLLILFNALPAFPMDGGRVLRAVLAMRIDYAMATQIAASIGKGVALVFFLCGLLFADKVFTLLFVAPFLWMVAGQEARMAVMRSQLSVMKVRDAMIRTYGWLAPTETLKQAAEKMFQSFQEDFPVLDGKRVVGLLTKGELLRNLSRRDMTTPLEHFVPRECTTIGPDENLSSAFTKLNASEAQLFPVVEQGEIVGVITLDQIGDYLQINQAILRWARGTMSPPKRPEAAKAPPSESPANGAPSEPAGKA